MIHVELDHILSEDDVAQRIRDLVAQVEQHGDMFVITNNGRPAVALVGIDKLESLSPAPAMITPPVTPVSMPTPMSTAPTPAPAAEPVVPSMPSAAPTPLAASDITPPTLTSQFNAATPPDPGSSSPLSEPLDEEKDTVLPTMPLASVDEQPVMPVPQMPTTPAPAPEAPVFGTPDVTLPPLPGAPEDPGNNSPLA